MKITIEDATKEEVRGILQQTLADEHANTEVEIIHPTREELTSPARLLRVGDKVHSERFGDGVVFEDNGDPEAKWPYKVEFDKDWFWCTASNDDSLYYVTKIEEQEFYIGQEVVIRGTIIELDDDHTPYRIDFGNFSLWFTEEELRGMVKK